MEDKTPGRECTSSNDQTRGRGLPRKIGIGADRVRYNPQLQMALTSGTKLGPYDIQSLLGAGGMGEVYRARDSRLGRIVAIKVLPTSYSADAERLQRFVQEARAAAALNHPNILSIFDIGEERGAPYIVSELLEGQTLRERIRGGPLSSRKAIDYALQVARGLAAAHDRGIVHRDLKPENLFLTNFLSVWRRECLCLSLRADAVASVCG